MVQALFQKFNILNLGAKPESLTKGGFDDCFVGLSFPRYPTTHFQRKCILTTGTLQRSAS